MSDSLRPHESQHARPPCPSPTPGIHSNSCPSSWWCHPAISSSVVPFPSCSQSLPASESFPMSQLFSWGGQSTGVSALASFLPKNTQDWSSLELDWLDLLAVQGTLKTLLQHHSSKASILRCLAFFTVQLSYPYMTTSTNTRKWAPFNWWVGAGRHFLPGLSPGSKEQGLLVIAHHKVLTDTVEGRGGLVNTEGTIWIFHSLQAFPHTTSVGRMKGWRSSHYYWVEMVIHNPHRVSTDDGGQGLIFEWMQKLWFSRRPPLGLLL